MKHFAGIRTLGLDLEPTVSRLRRSYPDRDWRVCDFDSPVESADMVICADVIEHLPNPDRLMRFLAGIRTKALFVSTPERLLRYGLDHDGPPPNRAHCREWTTAELRQYLARWFRVDDISITNRAQATQMALLRPLATYHY